MSQCNSTSKDCSVLRLSALPKKIPLKIPLIEDPRMFDLNRLRAYLKAKGIPADDGKTVLIARVLKDIVDNGLFCNVNPNDMDDRQPEKWIHIANLMLFRACEIEPESDKRIECMALVNKHLATLSTSRIKLIEIAIGVSVFETNSELYNVLARMGSALMLEPVIEAEMGQLNANDSESTINASITIFQMCTGFMKIPEHFTIETALAEANNRKSFNRNFKGVILCDNHNAQDGKDELVSVHIGSEVIIHFN